jgi:hypothetical protein
MLKERDAELRHGEPGREGGIGPLAHGHCGDRHAYDLVSRHKSMGCSGRQIFARTSWHHPGAYHQNPSLNSLPGRRLGFPSR